MADQTTVRWGNDNPQMQIKIPTIVEDASVEGGLRVDMESRSVPAEHLNQSVTEVTMWDGFDNPEFVEHTLSTDNDRMLTMISRGLDADQRKYAVGIGEMEQIVTAHAGGTKPAWVTSSDPEYAKALGQHFGCMVGEPTALLVSVGRDALHKQHLDTAAQPAAFNYMALTETATAPASGDTVLTGEITTAGGGLLRAQATFAHTTGTNTSTLTKTFTANGSDVLPKVLAAIGIFNNAVSGGTLGYHTLLSTTATLSASGDNVTNTWTDTAG